MADVITVLNTETGQTGTIKRKLLDNPALFDREFFTEVEESQKSYVPALFKPRTAKKYKEQHPEKVVAEDAAEAVADAPEKNEIEVTE